MVAPFTRLLYVCGIALAAFAHPADAQVPVIEPEQIIDGNFFAIAIHRDTIVAGPAEQGQDIEVYERRGSVWVHTDTLPVEEQDEVSHVALYGDTLLASIFGFEGHAFRCFVNVYTRRGGTWQRVQQLPICSGELSAGENLVALGGFLSHVEVFRIQPDGTLEHETTLTSDDESEVFGSDLAVAGHSVLVGGVFNSVVYVFTKTGGEWSQTSSFSPREPSLGFGQNVEVIGNVAIVESRFVFQRSGGVWYQQETLGGVLPPDELSQASLVDRNRVVVEVGDVDQGVRHFVATIGGVGGWTPIVQLDGVHPYISTPFASHGFVLIHHLAEGIEVYDVRSHR